MRSDLEDWLRIEGLIRDGKSNKQIIEIINTKYSEEFLNGFRKYLSFGDSYRKAREAAPGKCDTLNAVEAALRMVEQTIGPNDRAVGAGAETVAKHYAAIFDHSEAPVKLFRVSAKGVLHYDIAAGGIFLGGGCMAPNIKWEDLDRFIKDLRHAREIAKNLKELKDE